VQRGWRGDGIGEDTSALSWAQITQGLRCVLVDGIPTFFVSMLDILPHIRHPKADLQLAHDAGERVCLPHRGVLPDGLQYEQLINSLSSLCTSSVDVSLGSWRRNLGVISEECQ
jgi:hypothetical protein